MRNKLYILFFLVLVACQRQAEWPVDVYYICSTNVLSSQNDQGEEVYNATLTQTQKESLDREINFMHQQLGDSMNWYAPYYHQFTMNALLLSQEEFEVAFNRALEEVQQQFTYYLRHQNHHRPFFIVGFSQGAMMIPYLLDNMRDKDYERCLGVYMMGYRLSASQCLLNHIEPATGATDGKLISYNTVCSVQQQWNVVSEGACTCINPLNWCTDSTPATTIWASDTLTMVVDSTSHVLVCTADSNLYYMPELGKWIPKGCLHHWDILWYNTAIRSNMHERAKAYLCGR